MASKRILQVFDFDETLFRVPAFSNSRLSEIGSVRFDHAYDFYDHPVSLSEIVYDLKLISPVYEAWKTGSLNPEVVSVLITHRVKSLENQILEILEKRGILFDRVFLLGRASSKTETLDLLLKEFTHIEKIKIYEDSIQQIENYQRYLEEINRHRDTVEAQRYRYKTFIVDKSKMFLIKKVKLSRKTRIELLTTEQL